MTQAEYNASLSRLESELREIERIVALFKSGQTGLGTLTTLWRFGWRGI